MKHKRRSSFIETSSMPDPSKLEMNQVTCNYWIKVYHQLTWYDRSEFFNWMFVTGHHSRLNLTPMSMTNYGPDNQYNWTQQLRACTAVQICVSSKGNTQLARGLAETIGTIFLDKPFNHWESHPWSFKGGTCLISNGALTLRKRLPLKP